MSITEKQRQQQAELQKNLWSIADDYVAIWMPTSLKTIS